MKILVFGTGKMYQKVRFKIRKDIEIVAFLDNDPLKWGDLLDGVPIFCPVIVNDLTYEYIFLLSIYQEDMRKQLVQMGIDGCKVVGMDQIERLCVSEKTQYFGELSMELGPRRILFYSHALNSTGAQNVLYTAIQILQKKGFRLAVLSKKDGILRDSILDLGIPVIIMENPHADNSEFRELVDWADVVFVNTLWLYYAVEELLLLKKRVVWWIHETVGFSYLSDSLVQSINETDMLSVYVVSPLVKRRLSQKFGEDLRIRELAYGLPEYERTVNGAACQDKCRKLVFAIIGGIGKIKGQDIFIKAVELLGTQYRDEAEFWIVGGGQLESGDLVRASLYPCIKIVGELKNQDMPALYHMIDVVVCCSRQEAMSVVVTEGCMNEKLVMVSDVAGNADYIEDGENGLLFGSEDSGQLAKLMEWVVDHREKAGEIGRAGKAIYEKHFKMELFETNLLKVIEDMTEREADNGTNINIGTSL